MDHAKNPNNKMVNWCVLYAVGNLTILLYLKKLTVKCSVVA